MHESSRCGDASCSIPAAAATPAVAASAAAAAGGVWGGGVTGGGCWAGMADSRVQTLESPGSRVTHDPWYQNKMLNITKFQF